MGLIRLQDTAAIEAEATKILAEYAAVTTRAEWKGTTVFGGLQGVFWSKY